MIARTDYDVKRGVGKTGEIMWDTVGAVVCKGLFGCCVGFSVGRDLVGVALWANKDGHVYSGHLHIMQQTFLCWRLILWRVL
jgi:hypothetical protein